MKLPKWLPRLSRKQKIVRNLLTALVLAILVWGMYWDFAAPTLGLEVRWKAEEYGLDAPEVLYRSDWERGSADIVLSWPDGRLATAECYRGGLFRTVGNFSFAEPEDGAAVLYQCTILDPEAVYLWAEDDAARAVCRLRLRADMKVSFTDEAGVTIIGEAPEEQTVTAGAHYENWDETYTMETVPNDRGVYRFDIPRKYQPEYYGDGTEEERLRESAEQSVLMSFGRLRHGREGGRDFAADISVTFYDEAGNVLRTWEQELWSGFSDGADG